ncbi:MAG: FtsX-like permease family protein, partial [Acidobacteriota bacterium]
LAGVRALVVFDPASLPPLAPVKLDGVAVVFTRVLGVATTVRLGLVPALRLRRVDLVQPLRDGGPHASLGRARQRLRDLLVAGELAAAVVLLIGAGLMLRSLDALNRIDLGFDPERLLTLRVSVPEARYNTPDEVVDFYRRVTERVRALPGAEAAGLVRALPLATTIGDWGLDVEGYVEGPGRNAKGDWQIVSDGAFEAMGTRLVRGRWIAGSDRTETQLVAVINEALARAYWSDPSRAVGGRIRVGNPRNPWLTVVGIVADERHNGVTGRVKEKFYVPHSQWHVATGGNLVRSAFLVVRTAGDPLDLARPVRAAIGEIDPNLPVANIRPMTEVLAASLATPRLTGFLLGVFAFLALALAAVGIYGVLSYVVERRTREIGIRMAMGAGRPQVVGLVLAHAATLAGFGMGAGLAGALGLTRVMQGLLYQVHPVDPLTYGLVTAALAAVALAAAGLPAWRALRVSPVIALRAE